MAKTKMTDLEVRALKAALRTKLGVSPVKKAKGRKPADDTDEDDTGKGQKSPKRLGYAS